jgi:hypothetical protein
VTTDTDALLANTRTIAELMAELERLRSIERELTQPLGEMPALVGTDLVLVIQDQRDEALAELERVKRERDHFMAHAETLDADLERVKAERDEYAAAVQHASDLQDEAEARLDKALLALRRELGFTHGEDTIRRISAAIAEIEGEQT